MKCYEINNQVFTLEQALDYIRDKKNSEDKLFNITKVDERYDKIFNDTVNTSTYRKQRKEAKKEGKDFKTITFILEHPNEKGERLIPIFNKKNYEQNVKDELEKYYTDEFNNDETLKEEKDYVKKQVKAEFGEIQDEKISFEFGKLNKAEKDNINNIEELVKAKMKLMDESLKTASTPGTVIHGLFSLALMEAKATSSYKEASKVLDELTESGESVEKLYKEHYEAKELNKNVRVAKSNYNAYLNVMISKMFDPKINKDGNTEYSDYHDLFLGGITKEEMESYGTTPALQKATIRQTIQRTVREVVDRVVKQFPDNNFLSERTIITKDNDHYVIPEADRSKVAGFIGVMDVLGVNANNGLKIIDFKVSRKAIASWSYAKQYRAKYQLGFYRQMLSQKGFDAEEIGTSIMNVIMPDNNIMKMKLEEHEKEFAGSEFDLKTPFGKNIEKIFPKQDITQPTLENDALLLDTLKENTDALIGSYSTNKERYDKDYLEKRVFSTSDSFRAKKGNEDKLFAFKDFEEKDKFYYGKTREEFMEPGGQIDQYLDKNENSKKNIVSNVVSRINTLKSEDDKQGNHNMIFLTGNNITTETNNVLKEHLGTYVNENYEIINIEELQANNIIAVKDKQSNSIDLISIVNLKLDKNLSIQIGDNKTSSVFGKFLSDKDAVKLENELPFKIMNSSLSHLEQLKIMSSINTLSDMFKKNNYTIGKIKVLNYTSGLCELANIENLQSNYNYLIKLHNDNETDKSKYIINKTKNIKFDDFYEVVLNEVKNIMSFLPPTLETSVEKGVNGIEKLLEHNNIQEATKQILMLQRRMESEYPDLKSKKIDFNDKAGKTYELISSLLVSLSNINVEYQGIMETQGYSFKNFLHLINNEKYDVGFGMGLNQTTPQTNASNTVRNISQFYSRGYSQLRSEVEDVFDGINEISRKFTDKRMNFIDKSIKGNKMSIWKHLMELDGDKNLSQEMKVKNPNDKDVDLDQDERIFLHEIMWSINKYRIPKISDKERKYTYAKNAKEINQIPGVIDRKHNGTYWEIPISRASHYQIIHDNISKGLHNPITGMTQFFKRQWDSARDAYEDKSTFAEVSAEIQSQTDELQVPNIFRISENRRNTIIQNNGTSYCAIDLNYLALQVTNEYIKENIFNRLLGVTRSLLVNLEYRQTYFNENRQTEIDSIKDRRDTAILNKYLMSEDLKDPLKVLGFIKKGNSLTVLAGRPLLFIKEMTLGVHKAFNRAIGNTEGHFSHKSVARAMSIVYPNYVGKIKNLFDDGSYSEMTKLQLLNRRFGIANMDINMLVEKSRNHRFGLEGGFSKYAYIWSVAPDFFNRMIYMVAEMIENGCYDAYSLSKKGDLDMKDTTFEKEGRAQRTLPKGRLVYDFKKDKRFSEIHKLGFKSTSIDETYLKQKALYRVMREEFNSAKVLGLDDKLIKFGDPLLDAYTTRQRESIKEQSDTAYGYYDHETKSQVDMTAWGMVFKQFKTYLTGLKAYYLSPTYEEGDLQPGTARGSFKHAKNDKGEYLYRKMVDDPNDQTRRNLVKISKEEGDVKGLEPVLIWTGDFNEGLLVSLVETIKAIGSFKFKENVWDKKGRLGNMKKMLHDIAFITSMYVLFQILMGDSNDKDGEGNYIDRKKYEARAGQLKLYKMIKNEILPFSEMNLTFQISALATAEKWTSGALKLITDDDPDLGRFLESNILAAKDPLQILNLYEKK